MSRSRPRLDLDYVSDSKTRVQRKRDPLLKCRVQNFCLSTIKQDVFYFSHGFQQSQDFNFTIKSRSKYDFQQSQDFGNLLGERPKFPDLRISIGQTLPI